MGVAAAGAGNSLAAYASYQAIMREVQLQSGATAEAMKQIDAAAMSDAMAKLGKSAREAAEGYKILASLGYDAATMQEMMIPITQASVALGTDQAETTKLMIALMTQYNLGAEDMTMIADMMVGGLAKTAMQGTDLIAVMKYAGIAASALGWDLVETIAATDGLVRAFGSGEMAGVAFRGMLNRMEAPSAEMEEAFHSAGLDVNDFAKHSGSAVEVLAWLQQGEWDAMKAAKAFGAEVANGANIWIKTSIPAMQATAATMYEVGIAARFAAGMMGDLNGAWEQGNAHIDNMVVHTGQFVAILAGPYLSYMGEALLQMDQFIKLLIDAVKQEDKGAAEAELFAMAMKSAAEVAVQVLAGVVAVLLLMVMQIQVNVWAVNTLYLAWLKLRTIWDWSDALKQNIIEQEIWLDTILSNIETTKKAMQFAWNWAWGGDDAALDKLGVGGEKQKKTTPADAAGGKGTKNQADLDKEWASWLKEQKGLAQSWSMYYDEQGAVLTDAIARAQNEQRAAWTAYQLASATWAALADSGRVEDIEQAAVAQQQAYINYLRADTAMNEAMKQADERKQQVLQRQVEKAERELQREREKAQRAMEKTQTDWADRYSQTVKNALDLHQTMQMVIGGRLGEGIEERLRRITVRPQGNDRIILELRPAAGVRSDLKRDIISWLVPVIQDASRRVPVPSG